MGTKNEDRIMTRYLRYQTIGQEKKLRKTKLKGQIKVAKVEAKSKAKVAEAKATGQIARAESRKSIAIQEQAMACQMQVESTKKQLEDAGFDKDDIETLLQAQALGNLEAMGIKLTPVMQDKLAKMRASDDDEDSED